MKCSTSGNKDQVQVHMAISLEGEIVMASEHKELAVSISNARNNALDKDGPKYGVVTVNIPKRRMIETLKKKLYG